MSLDDLRVFAEVARVGSFSGAAQALGLPRSTVSRRVAALEEQVGGRLLHRSTRRVALSPRGRSLYEQAGPHLAALNGIGSSSGSEARGRVRLTATPDIAWSVLGPAVARYLARFPGMDVEVVPSLRVIDLQSEPMDFALRIYGGDLPALPGLTASRLGSIRLGLYASPVYLDRAGVPDRAEHLADHAMVLPAGARVPEIAPHARLSSEDTTFQLAATRQGAGISVFPNFVVADDVATGRLVPVLSSWAAWTGALWLLSPHERDAPPFIRVLRELIVESTRRKVALAGAHATHEPSGGSASHHP